MLPKAIIRTPILSSKALLKRVAEGRIVSSYRRRQVIFAQGEPADAVFYLQKGRVRLTVVSHHGKEAVVAILGPKEFFGEGCLAGQRTRMSTATPDEASVVLRLSRKVMVERLHSDPEFSEMFMAYLLSRNVQFEEALVDQLFNSCEKRLARILLMLAHFGKEGRHEVVVPKISQETLAGMIGTTRSRVSHFMNKFRDLGFIDYNREIQVHSSLLNAVLQD